jgi:hypothetical protein
MKRAIISVGKVELEFRHLLYHLGSPVGAISAIQDLFKSLLDFGTVRFIKNEPCGIDINKRFILHVETVFSIRESGQSRIQFADELLIPV